jgi:hypothetical protein
LPTATSIVSENRPVADVEVNHNAMQAITTATLRTTSATPAAGPARMISCQTAEGTSVHADHAQTSKRFRRTKAELQAGVSSAEAKRKRAACGGDGSSVASTSSPPDTEPIVGATITVDGEIWNFAKATQSPHYGRGYWWSSKTRSVQWPKPTSKNVGEYDTNQALSLSQTACLCRQSDASFGSWCGRTFDECEQCVQNQRAGSRP